jgi:hypothetical protein
VLGEQPLHHVGQAGVEQAAGGQVDRDGHPVAGVQPAALLCERHVEDPLGQSQDDAGALGDRECGWRPMRTVTVTADSACSRARSAIRLLSTVDSTAPTAIVTSD